MLAAGISLVATLADATSVEFAAGVDTRSGCLAVTHPVVAPLTETFTVVLL